MKKKLVIVISIMIFIIGFAILRNLSLGYNLDSMIYDKNNGNQTIELGVPELSFMKKENDKSYSYKNIRNNKTLHKEVKQFLNTLDPIECNNTTYYYDNKNDFTIIDYSIIDHFLYNTISYSIFEGDYCLMDKLNYYSESLGGLMGLHTLNGGKISLYDDWDTHFEVMFLDGGNSADDIYEFKANLIVYLYKRIDDNHFDSIILEDSVGDIEILDNKLYFYRNEIKQDNDSLEIPEESVFKLEDGKMILVDNYLSDYYADEIVLK